MEKTALTKKQTETLESLTGAQYNEKKGVLEKTTFPIATTLKDIDIVPLPGRYFIRPVSDDFAIYKKLATSILPKSRNDDWDFNDIERWLYDDMRQAIVVAVGDPFKRQDGTMEEPLCDVGSLIIANFSKRVFPHVVYKGYVLFIITGGDILSFVKDNADMRLLEDVKKK